MAGSIPRSLAATKAQIAKANVVVLDNRSQGEIDAAPKVDGARHVLASMADIDSAIASGVIPKSTDTPIVAY